jgi:lysozyme
MNWKAKLAALGLAVLLPMLGLYEGLERTAYHDPLGIPTVCYGHTGPDVKLGQVYTAAQCDELLAKDILVANSTINSCITAPLTPNQRAAFVSFTFNVGPGGRGVKDGFCTLKSGRPSTMRLLINAGQPEKACSELLKWTMPGTVVHRGLLKRRNAEYKLCMTR